MRLGIDAGDHSFSLAERYGIKGVPISLDTLVANGVTDTLVPLRDHGLEVCQIGAMGYNPLSPDRESLERQTALLETGIPLASETGCSCIAISCGSYAESAFGGFHADNYTPKAIEDMAKMIAPLLELAGDNGVFLSIEAYIKGVINSPDTFDSLAELTGSSAIKINLDITSLYDLKDLIDPEPICRTMIPKYNGKVGIVHFKGIALDEGFHIHAGLKPITEDPTDWRFVLEETSKVVEADTWVILEHVLSEEEGEKSIMHIKNLASELHIDL